MVIFSSCFNLRMINIETVRMGKMINIENNESIKNKIYIVIGILCFLLIFYLLTLYITRDTSSSSNSDTTTDTTISYDKILIGRSLNISDGEYLVLFYDTTDEDLSSTYAGLYSSYKSSSQLPIFYVDMGSAFNKAYVTTEESNKTPESASDFLINGPTLIRVNENKVVDYIEGEADITEYLN